jgi:hypothetical protein
VIVNTNVNGPRAYARRAHSHRARSRSQAPPRLRRVAGTSRLPAPGAPRGGDADGTRAAHDSELPEGVTPEHGGPCGGRLTPCADPVTGALGWKVLTASRRLAATVAAISSGKAHPHQAGGWQASIPQTALTVTVTGADSGALWCRLGGRPESGVLTVAFAPWTAATVLKCPVTAFPARGTLSVRDVRMTTRMGRTVRFLVPQFISS